MKIKPTTTLNDTDLALLKRGSNLHQAEMINFNTLITSKTSTRVNLTAGTSDFNSTSAWVTVANLEYTALATGRIILNYVLRIGSTAPTAATIPYFRIAVNNIAVTNSLIYAGDSAVNGSQNTRTGMMAIDITIGQKITVQGIGNGRLWQDTNGSTYFNIIA